MGVVYPQKPGLSPHYSHCFACWNLGFGIFKFLYIKHTFYYTLISLEDGLRSTAIMALVELKHWYRMVSLDGCGWLKGLCWGRNTDRLPSDLRVFPVFIKFQNLYGIKECFSLFFPLHSFLLSHIQGVIRTKALIHKSLKSLPSEKL